MCFTPENCNKFAMIPFVLSIKWKGILSQNSVVDMKAVFIIIIYILFFQKALAGSVDGRKEGKAINGKILSCFTKLFKFIDDNLPEDIHILLEQV